MAIRFLIENANANIDGEGVISDGSRRQIFIYATSFGGGTVTIQSKLSADGAPWITLTLPDGTPAQFTGNDTRVVDYIAQGCEIRATLTSSTNPENVNVAIA